MKARGVKKQSLLRFHVDIGDGREISVVRQLVVVDFLQIDH